MIKVNKKLIIFFISGLGLSCCSNQCSLKGAHCVLNQKCLTQLYWKFVLLLNMKIHLYVTKLKILSLFLETLSGFFFFEIISKVSRKWCLLSAMGPNITKVSTVLYKRTGGRTGISFPSFLVITLELRVETLLYRRGIFCRF